MRPERIKNFMRRYIPVGRIKDEPLDRIKCIRHTITWRCNYKCTSCDIWKIEKGKNNRVADEATPRHIEGMCQSPLLKDVSEVIISGGEPTLRSDFVELIMAYHRNLPKAQFGITINGWNPDRAHQFFSEIKRQSKGKMVWKNIGVSLNGRKEVHDKSRGVACFENVLETAKALKEFSRNVGFSFTFLENNIDHFDYCKRLAQSMGLSIHVCWTVMNERFKVSNKDLVFKNNPELIPVLERFVDADKIKPRGNVRRDFIRYKPNIKAAYLYDSVLNRRIMPCHAAQTFLHVDPYGDVYPCNFDLRKERILGSIKESSIDEILKSVNSQLLDDISLGKCMYPKGNLCGDSDINRSIGQVDTPAYRWYVSKRMFGQKLIEVK